MAKSFKAHMIQQEFSSFLVDRKLRKLSKNTINFYSWQLSLFERWCESQGVETVPEITPTVLRTYFLELGETRNPGGVHAMWRTIKVFLRWWGEEYEPDSWKNPIAKVPPPKINTDPLEGISLEHFQILLDTCDRSILGLRDRAIFVLLLDTGLRMAELLDLHVEDINLSNGAVNVRSGKGGKQRTIYMGIKARRDLVKYLRRRGKIDDADPLFTTQSGSRFSRGGLRQMVKNRARGAGIPAPGLHDFRRTFAIQALRNGADTLSLSRMLGHSTVTLVERYAKQNTDDLRRVHDQISPMDNL